MEAYEQATKTMNELERLKPKAIEELLAARERAQKHYELTISEINMKLAGLGYTDNKLKRPCSVCGQTGHDGRAHKKQKSEQE